MSVKRMYGPPDTFWTYHDQQAGEVTLHSDGKGAVRVASADEERVALALGLTIVPGEAPIDEQPAPEPGQEG